MISHSNFEYFRTPWYYHYNFFRFYEVPTYVESYDLYHTDSLIYILLVCYVLLTCYVFVLRSYLKNNTLQSVAKTKGKAKRDSRKQEIVS